MLRHRAPSPFALPYSASTHVFILKTHGTVSLRSGLATLEADYCPGSGEAGLLSMNLEDQETGESVRGTIRLDPWLADEYRVIELTRSKHLVICGAQAVVTVDASNLALRSSLSLEYEEGETLDSPWHAEIEADRSTILATERRVWCLDERGAIRWVWACRTSDEHEWISGAPAMRGDRVRVPLRNATRDRTVDLYVTDGLPAPP